MRRLVYAGVVGLVLAGIVHILIVLLIPSYADKDAWAKLEQRGDPWQFAIVSEPNRLSSDLPNVDPAFGIAACRFDLSEAPLRVSAQGDLPFWSVAIFDRKGRNIYSFNDRTAIDRQLLLLVVEPVQMAQIRKNPPTETDRAVLFESTATRGFVLIRALQNNDTWRESVESFLKSAQCEKAEFEEVGQEDSAPQS